MGKDVAIHIKTKNGYVPDDGLGPWVPYRDYYGSVIPDQYVWRTGMRLWAPDYQRGHWPTWLGWLVELLADNRIEQVRYGSDEDRLEDTVDVSLGMLMAYTKAYIEAGRGREVGE